jgi:hypothetical protein
LGIIDGRVAERQVAEQLQNLKLKEKQKLKQNQNKAKNKIEDRCFSVFLRREFNNSRTQTTEKTPTA